MVSEPTDDSCGGHEGWDALAPREYTAWMEWAEGMAQTHRQKRCPACGRWKIWVPRGSE